METKSYSDKLKDPRWQKKRLEIFQRDKFTCRICKSTDVTLHVHHRRYISGIEPWGYPDKLLVTLCEDCHQSETENGPELFSQLMDAIKDNFLTWDLPSLISAFEGLDRYPEIEDMSLVISHALTSHELLKVIAESLHKELIADFNKGVE